VALRTEDTLMGIYSTTLKCPHCGYGLTFLSFGPSYVCCNNAACPSKQPCIVCGKPGCHKLHDGDDDPTEPTR
jgi:hypothetical protein